MPVIEPSGFRPRFYHRNGHWQTWSAALFRRIHLPEPERTEFPTPDGDFLDLDWHRRGSPRLAVLLHGLEGSSRAGYIRGMATALGEAGWDCLAVNFRGCGGRPNRLPRFYHSGETGDLHAVLTTAVREHPSIALIGFSLGGNVILKYLGENPASVDPRVRAAVAFSVPCDLAASAARLAEPQNRVYMRRFLKTLRGKIAEKSLRFPESFDTRELERIRTFAEFDDRYTAPVHGFRDAADYWDRCGSGRFLADIRVPALLVNARNDPFLPEACFPFEAARGHPCFHFEAPAHGGHVGFLESPLARRSWAEKRAVEFLATHSQARA